MNTADIDYEALASRAEQGKLPAKNAGHLTGELATTAGREMLMTAAGTTTIEDAARVALGRPTVAEQGRGPSPVWKVRTTAELDSIVREMAAARGESVSSLIRQAVAEYVHHAA